MFLLCRLKNLTDKERITERRISSSELIEFLQKQLTKPANEVAEHSAGTTIRLLMFKSY
jgi:hypothetical protein